jgi:hypothetical protein
VPAKKRKCSECSRLRRYLRESDAALIRTGFERDANAGSYRVSSHDAELTIANITYRVIGLRQLWDESKKLYDAEKKAHEQTLRTLDELRREKNREIAESKEMIGGANAIIKTMSTPLPSKPWYRRSLRELFAK